MAAESIFNLIFKADTKEIKDAKATLGELKGKFSELTSQVPGLNDVMSTLGDLAKATSTSFTSLATGLVGVGVASAAAAVALGSVGVAMAFNWNEKIGALNDLGDKLGISANQALYLKEAMSGAGLGIETLITAQEKLSKSMMKSGDESKGAGEAFARLGIETTDNNGKLKATGDVLDAITKKYQDEKGAIDLSKLTTQEMADLQLTLGKNYREVLMAQVELQKAQAVHNEMMEAGIGISTRSNEIEDANAKQQLRLQGVLSQMGSILQEMVIPAWTSLTEWFVNSYKEGGVVVTIFNMIANSTKLIVEVFKAVIAQIGLVVESFFNLGNVTKVVMSGVWTAMRGDFSGGADAIMKGVESFMTKQKDIGLRQIELIKSSAGGIASAVADVWNNRDVVGEAKATNKSDTAFNNRTIRPPGSVSGGTPNAVKEAKEKKDPIDALIKSLEQQLRVSDELNISEQVRDKLRSAEFAMSDKLKMQRAQEIADKITLANANKSVQAMTDDLIKQTNATENMTEAMKLEIQLREKKNQGASAEVIAAARVAAVNKDLADSHKEVNKLIKDVSRSSDDYVRGLQDELRMRSMSNNASKEYQELRRLDIQLERQLADLKEKNKWNLEEETRLVAANEEAKKKVRDVTKEVQAADDDWLTVGIDKYIKGLGTFEEAAANLVTNGIQGLSGAIVDLFSGGSQNFKQFTAGILKMIAQMIVQFLVLIPIVNALKAALGSWGGGAGVNSAAPGTGAYNVFANYARGGVSEQPFMKAFASGAVLNTPTVGWFGGEKAMAGESGPEAIVPLKRNSAGELGVQMSGGGGGVNIGPTTNVFKIEAGSGTGDQSKDTALARILMDQMDRRWDEKLAKASRVGGALNPTRMMGV